MWTPSPSNTPIPRLTPLTTPNGIQIQLVVLPQYTLQTDRQTDRPSDGLCDKSVPTAAYALLYYSDAAKNALKKLIKSTRVIREMTVSADDKVRFAVLVDDF